MEENEEIEKENKTEKDFINYIMYSLTAPCIYMPTWEPPINVLEKRKIHLLVETTCFDKEVCTDYDAMIYISTVSLNNPLSYHWGNIYRHLSMKYYGDMDPPDVEKDYDRELDGYEKQLLLELKQWIFKKQIEHIRSNAKEGPDCLKMHPCQTKLFGD